MKPLTFIVGPCVLSGEGEIGLHVADALAELQDALGVDVYFKASFDKANRTRASSYRGPGLMRGLEMLRRVKARTGLRITTDIHAIEQAAPAAEVADLLQIPAFLCRQTDLIAAAAQTGRPLNIKKGQFIAPQDTRWIAEKAHHYGVKDLYITERGVTFGYGDLVVDPRTWCILQELGAECGFTAIHDATHCVQQPSTQFGTSGGQSKFVVPLALAAAATGIRTFFMETWPDPNLAVCDGPNSLPLSELRGAITRIKAVADLVANTTP